MTEPSIVVRVPASSANLGPGFDTLGLALGLYNDVGLTVSVTPTEPSITVIGEGVHSLPRDRSNLAHRVIQSVFESVHSKLFIAAIDLKNNIPVQSGLGSSAATIVGSIIAASSMLDEPLADEECMRIALQFESHPDNLAASLYGGFTIALLDDDGKSARVASYDPPPELSAIVLFPELEIETAASRATLPSTVTLADATYNIAHTAFLVSAIISGESEDLHDAMRDRLHQAHRAIAYPAMPHIIEAAYEAGAVGATLSGSGPCILALCLDQEDDEVGAAMSNAATDHGVGSRLLSVSLPTVGAMVVDDDQSR